MAKVYLETYGCTLNQADSDKIEAILRARGHGVACSVSRVPCPDDADVIILNTCTVKGPTENKILERIRKLETGNRTLVICGCMAANAEKLRRFTNAPIVWPGAIARIGDAVEDALCGQATEYKAPESKEGLPSVITKPIMRLAIAEGCTGSCTFCQTKLARPLLRSMSPQGVLRRMADGVKAGAKEIQLTAMDTGAYGLDVGTGLPALLDCVNGMEGGFLVRLGMINPDHALRMEGGLLSALKGPRLYKFLHAPVQSGSENVCRDMGRRHTVADFEAVVRDFRKEIPDITIATDIIVGYPTEGEKDFGDTIALLSRVKPDVVNLSRFSPRPGTKAKALRPLDNREVKRRSAEAAALARGICAERNRALVGKTLDVLITERQRDFTGRTIGYKQVVVKDFHGALGDRVRVKITDANHGSLFGYRA